MDCNVPTTILTNAICIQKISMVNDMVHYEWAEDDYDETERWRQEEEEE